MVDLETSHKIECAELEADILRNQTVLKLRAEALAAKGRITDQARSSSGSVSRVDMTMCRGGWMGMETLPSPLPNRRCTAGPRWDNSTHKYKEDQVRTRC